jgi:hypothetical protein
MANKATKFGPDRRHVRVEIEMIVNDIEPLSFEIGIAAYLRLLLFKHLTRDETLEPGEIDIQVADKGMLMLGGKVSE